MSRNVVLGNARGSSSRQNGGYHDEQNNNGEGDMNNYNEDFNSCFFYFACVDTNHTVLYE